MLLLRGLPPMDQPRLLLALRRPFNILPMRRRFRRLTSPMRVKSATKDLLQVRLEFLQSPTNLTIFSAGDEAAAIGTAPALSKVDDIYPLVAPAAADKNAEEFDVVSYFGNYSPMKSVHSFGLSGASPQIPDGCGLKQVHLLHRHGARYSIPPLLPLVAS